jgi:hypothetical protein
LKRSVVVFVAVMSVFSASCEIDQKLPSNAVILEQVVFVDEVKEGVPQTLLMPSGTTVTYKMPEKLHDGQLIKVKDIEGERPYYIRISLRYRDEKKK